ncbi:kynurenine formamidase [Phymastichus coffea]|uniref:kynurenine formamidase n=1 Tax=Phymastichus coffea TaxID=108790 RepID=UPI00273CE2F2|nr:kynurenine formamidase [Phymastichus coffea]XP_058805143.1 kynurenine formamidase [Phymastichus coffea]XP_058805144.1 kynurenine formamidase [Phymastichus coffea]XP_058805145.1 kynurenine formamidase [Phymastichus coffea]
MSKEVIDQGVEASGTAASGMYTECSPSIDLFKRLDSQQLEKLYLPSNWSKRHGPTELLVRYFEFCQDATLRARCTFQHELDIPYGPGEKTKYDIYGTNLPKEAPILLFIHGGYWQEFSKDLSGFAVLNFVTHGIKVIIGGYDLCPAVTLTDIVQETKQLAQTILTLARSSGSKCVWIVGHSAGAHLAASLLHDRDWLRSMDKLGCRHFLKGLVLISGIYALEPLLRVSVNNLLQLTSDEIKLFTFAPLYGTENNAAAAAAPAEPLQNLKVLVTVGECDSPIFVEESRRYARHITMFVDNVEFLLIRDNTDHFDIVQNLIKTDFSLSEIIINYIKS